jgi:hypothetical protein
VGIPADIAVASYSNNDSDFTLSFIALGLLRVNRIEKSKIATAFIAVPANFLIAEQVQMVRSRDTIPVISNWIRMFRLHRGPTIHTFCPFENWNPI